MPDHPPPPTAPPDSGAAPGWPDLPPHLQAACAALEAQRAVLGDAAVDAALAALRASVTAAPPAPPATPGPAPVATPKPASAPAAAPQRRQVTILFMDVVGSTSLSQQLDPEDIQLVLDGLLAEGTAVIQRHGGRVLQYAGDNILAAFGAEVAHEDDAESALRAGLDLLALGSRYGAEVKRRYGHAGFNVRLGVHTGHVVLGGGVDADGSIRGMAVNVAARLEQMAPPGGLRISQETYRHVRGLFETEAQEPLHLKGLDEPVPSYLVRGVKARSFFDVRRGVDGVQVGMVGRGEELARLLDALRRAQASGTLQSACLLADAGLGKSRLLAEFERALLQAAAPPLLLHGRSHPHSRQQAHGLLRDLLCRHFKIAESDALDTARAKLQAGWQQEGGTPVEAALLGQLIGLDFSTDAEVAGMAHDARQLRTRAYRAALGWIERGAGRAGAAVLLLDDLHWSDDGSLDFIDHLARQPLAAPVLVVCGARPALLEHREGWGGAWPQAVTLRLQALPDRGAALLDALLAPVQGVPEGLREMLLAQADGNPFYLEELVQMLMDDHVIDTTQQPWAVALQRLGGLRVPTTLVGVLQARLDGLPGPERLTLQRASVVGAVFWDAALDVDGLRPAPATLLPALEGRGPVHRQPQSEFEGAAQYRFRHHLLHQVTYDTVLKRERVPWHRATAQWLVNVAGERLGEHAATIAQHFEQGGDNAAAAQFYARAGLAANAAAMYTTALELGQRALALMDPGDSSERVILLTNLANTCNSLGRRDEQRRYSEDALRMADALGDPGSQVEALCAMTLVHMVSGRWAEGIASADRTIAAAQGSDQLAAAAMPMADKAYALHMMGQLDAAEALLREVLSLPTSARVRVTCLSRLATVMRVKGRPSEQLDHLGKAVALAEASHLRRFAAGLQNNLAIAEATYGNYEAAASLLASSLAGLQAIGDRGGEAYTLWTMAELATLQGDPERALTVCELALAQARATGDGGLVQQLLGLRARLALDADDLAAASEALSQNQSADPAALPLAEQATLWLRQGRIDMAADAAGRWLARPVHDSADFGDAHLADRWRWYQTMVACGLHEGALRTLERAFAHLRQIAMQLPLHRRRQYLEHVSLNRAVIEAAAAAGLGEPIPLS